MKTEQEIKDNPLKNSLRTYEFYKFEYSQVEDIANKIMARMASIGLDAMTMTIGEKENEK